MRAAFPGVPFTYVRATGPSRWCGAGRLPMPDEVRRSFVLDDDRRSRAREHGGGATGDRFFDLRTVTDFGYHAEVVNNDEHPQPRMGARAPPEPWTEPGSHRRDLARRQPGLGQEPWPALSARMHLGGRHVRGPDPHPARAAS
jgi:hypothetical protein